MTDVDVRRGGFRKGAGRKPIPGRVRTLNYTKLFVPAQTMRRECGYTIHFWKKDKHHKNLALRVFCSSWACPRCHEYNKRKWISHIKAMTIFGVPGAFFNKASVFETSDSYWKSSVKKQLSRQNVDFVRVRLHDGRLAVINNRGFGELLSGDSFNSALEKIFAAVGHDRKPVSPSKRWQLRKTVPVFQFERLNNLHLTLPELRDELNKLRLKSEYSRSSHNGIFFEYPDDWPEELVQVGNRYLASMTGEQPQ